MIGPECVAQQKKLVRARMMNGGDFSACAIVISGPAEGGGAAPFAIASNTGGRRMKKDIGTMVQATMIAMVSIEKRQSLWVISQLASGVMVAGAKPMPAETSETARLTRVSNQPVTVAISGAMMAE